MNLAPLVPTHISRPNDVGYTSAFPRRDWPELCVMAEGVG